MAPVDPVVMSQCRGSESSVQKIAEPLRSADSPRASEPLRCCVGCRRRGGRSELLRVVRDPADASRVVVDERRRMPGRGAWLHSDQECLKQAVKRRAFQRALRSAVESQPVEAYFGSSVPGRAGTDVVQGESRSEI